MQRSQVCAIKQEGPGFTQGKEPSDQETSEALGLLPVQGLPRTQGIEGRQYDDLLSLWSRMPDPPSGPMWRRVHVDMDPAGLLTSQGASRGGGKAISGVEMTDHEGPGTEEDTPRGPCVPVEVANPIPQKARGRMEDDPRGEQVNQASIMVPENDLHRNLGIPKPLEKAQDLPSDEGAHLSHGFLDVPYEQDPSSSDLPETLQDPLGQLVGGGIGGKDPREGFPQTQMDVGGHEGRDGAAHVEHRGSPQGSDGGNILLREGGQDASRKGAGTYPLFRTRGARSCGQGSLGPCVPRGAKGLRI